MIDLKLLRTSPQQVRAALARRGDPGLTRLLDEVEALDMKRRSLASRLDQLNAERNEAARVDAAHVKREGSLPAAVTAKRRELGTQVAELEDQLKSVEADLERKALFVPNLPLPELPDGDASHNAIVRTWGEPAPRGGKPHWEIGAALGILDLERGAKLAGSGFPVFVGAGAKLVRGLINFMLDLHTGEHGYVEVEPPFVVKRETMEGTGQLPKLEDDAYKTAPDDLFLVPTAEVPVTNLHRDEILDGTRLPLGYTAYTPCFRREAGAAGRDTRGLLRVHQFDKVELVRFARPAESAAEHERMTAHAEAVLQRLELPYRIALLAAGDLVHTLNASGVPLPRTIAALLETHQQAAGSVTLPRALAPYVGMERLGPPLPPPAASSSGAP
ncbi:MAG: serine--tRNA ligase [Gemmatimonadetes bacterium]|nr:MAG: serine--tRNA ligase [Gemmatimonadota bacterium]